MKINEGVIDEENKRVKWLRYKSKREWIFPFWTRVSQAREPQSVVGCSEGISEGESEGRAGISNREFYGWIDIKIKKKGIFHVKSLFWSIFKELMTLN